MIEIIGIIHIDYGYSYISAYNEQNETYGCTGEQFNNEYLQAMRQSYEFTFKDHLYEKNNKYYKYNNKTLKFDELGDEIKCEENEEGKENDNKE